MCVGGEEGSMSPLLAWHEVGEHEAQHAGIVEGWKRWGCEGGGGVEGGEAA